MPDERKNKPSASAVYRYAACPGSFRLSQGCKESRSKEMKEWAESGNRIHAVLAGQAGAETLKPEELEVFERCRDVGCKVVDALIPNAASHVEKRLWLTKGRKKLISGKADHISVSNIRSSGVVLDYKTNRGDQDEADENHQLRTLIVLAAEEWPQIETWHAAIIQPLVTTNPKVVTYTKEHVATAKAELLAILEAINKPDAPTRAGDHCKFCPAVLKCESAKSLLEVFGMIDPDAAEGEALAGLLNLAKAADAISKRVRDRAKELLKTSTGCIAGWQLGKPSSTRNITNPFGCFEQLTAAGLINRDTFLKECVSVGVGDVERAVAKFNRMTPRDAKDAVNATCISVMEFKQKEPSLEQA